MTLELWECAEERAEAATVARDEAVERVGKHAGDLPMARALVAVEQAARRWPDGFTTDDVQALAGDVGFHEPRAWGAAMRKAQKAGVCEPTNMQRQSRSARCHARPKRVWKRGNDQAISRHE